MNEHHFQVLLTFCGGLVTGAVGLFTGWLATRWQRQSDEKRRIAFNMADFKGFLGRWAGIIETRPTPEVERICTEYMEHLCGYCWKYKRDFTDAAEVERRSQAICDAINVKIRNYSEIKQKIKLLNDFL
ncbi:MAG: hypothetical protein ABSF34_13330 [Verrucomicrobiota bacterium]|jgi:hypothetical protein